MSATFPKNLWTSADLALLLDNGNCYEIIDGELLVTRAPHWQHQTICGNFYSQLQAWSQATGLGRACRGGGVIFSDSNDVIPDVVWLSMEKYRALIDEAGHVRGAPDVGIEVLSSSAEHERRDRPLKLKLYSTQGVLEYWIADWRRQTVEVFRREAGLLKLALTLYREDTLTSPLLLLSPRANF